MRDLFLSLSRMPPVMMLLIIIGFALMTTYFLIDVSSKSISGYSRHQSESLPMGTNAEEYIWVKVPLNALRSK